MRQEPRRSRLQACRTDNETNDELEVCPENLMGAQERMATLEDGMDTRVRDPKLVQMPGSSWGVTGIPDASKVDIDILLLALSGTKRKADVHGLQEVNDWTPEARCDDFAVIRTLFYEYELSLQVLPYEDPKDWNERLENFGAIIEVVVVVLRSMIRTTGT
ncbi:hypothetical protein BJV74DRAFT_799120 [Russula compacta]|nr:hypothetical protein BJV74DRAFT_799120 [Russula compacta]